MISIVRHPKATGSSTAGTTTKSALGVGVDVSAATGVVVAV
jgi:hypothetical protein